MRDPFARRTPDELRLYTPRQIFGILCAPDRPATAGPAAPTDAAPPADGLAVNGAPVSEEGMLRVMAMIGALPHERVNAVIAEKEAYYAARP